MSIQDADSELKRVPAPPHRLRSLYGGERWSTAAGRSTDKKWPDPQLPGDVPDPESPEEVAAALQPRRAALLAVDGGGYLMDPEDWVDCHVFYLENMPLGLWELPRALRVRWQRTARPVHELVWFLRAGPAGDAFDEGARPLRLHPAAVSYLGHAVVR